jgi:2-polyprenyl-3-methyl-5-hydroxy-6-metoxy-1,4-benzoquinol methylase
MDKTYNENTRYFSNDRKEMIPFIPPDCKRILEIGCSEGVFGNLLKTSRMAEVWGVEKEKEAVLHARKNLDFVIQGDFLEVENQLPRNHFDCVVLNDVIEHFTDPWRLLSNLKPLLTSGGYVVSSIPNVRYIGNLYELIIKKDWEYKSSGILDMTHYRFYTQKSMIRLFECSGFKIIRIQGINPTKSFKVRLGALLTLGFFYDIKYLEFAVVAQVSS